MTALPPELTIDDLAFADLLKIALDDLPGASGGAWTLHGAVDPGVTLLELFAYLAEQRLFAAEQVTEPQVRAGLRLLGLGDLRPARAAVTVLTLRNGGEVRSLPAGAVMNLQDDADGRRFASVHAVDVLPVHGVTTDGTARAAGDRLEIVLDRDGPILRDVTLSLLVDVVAHGAVVPAWSEVAEDVPPPAELAWTAVGPDGTQQPVVPEDSTGGLRRPGLLRIAWPEVWNRVGGRGCRLVASVRAGFFTEPVRFRAVHANAVVVRHLVPAHTEVTDQVAGLLPLPGQRLRLPDARGLLHEGPDAVTLHLTELDGHEHDWVSVTSWVGVGPDERVVVVDRARGELVFGDGRAGRVPRPAPAGRATVDHLLGGGPAGNLGPGGTWSEEAGPVVGVNPVPAVGGTPAEDLAGSRQRAADELARADRTVTRADVETLALSTPGVDVARVHVSAGHHPEFPCVDVSGAVTVTVVPGAGRSADQAMWTLAPAPDPGLVEAVRRRLEQARLLGQEVFVVPPTYRRVRVRVTVTRSAGDDTVAGRVTSEIRRHLDPLVGGHDADGWTFGGAVRPSDLLGVAARAAGAEATVTRMAVALDDDPETDCGEVVIGPRDLVWLAGAQVDTTAAVPSGGGLA